MKGILGNKASFDKAIRQVRHKFEIPDTVEFDILKDVHEGVLMSINDIPKKAPSSSRPPTPPVDTLLTNAGFGEEEER